MRRNKLMPLTQATEERAGSQQATLGWRKEEDGLHGPLCGLPASLLGGGGLEFSCPHVSPLPLSLIQHPASFMRIYEAFPQYESNYYFTYLNTLLRRPHRKHATHSKAIKKKSITKRWLSTTFHSTWTEFKKNFFFCLPYIWQTNPLHLKKSFLIFLKIVTKSCTSYHVLGQATFIL